MAGCVGNCEKGHSPSSSFGNRWALAGGPLERDVSGCSACLASCVTSFARTAQASVSRIACTSMQDSVSDGQCLRRRREPMSLPQPLIFEPIKRQLQSLCAMGVGSKFALSTTRLDISERRLAMQCREPHLLGTFPAVAGFLDFLIRLHKIERAEACRPSPLGSSSVAPCKALAGLCLSARWRCFALLEGT